MRPKELVVRAATAGDADFISSLRSHPASSEFLAVLDQDPDDLRGEFAAATDGSGRLIAETGSRAVAALRWTVVNRRSRIAELSEVIVDPAARGRGLAAHFVREASQWLVDRYAVHRVQLEVYGDNPAAQRAFEHAGFQREGTRRRAYWRRAAWQDGVHYGLLADEL